MTPAQAQALVTSTSSLGMVSEILLALQVQILLLQEQTGNTMTGSQLATAAGQQFGNITDILTAELCIIYLLEQGGGGTGGGGTGGVGPPTAPGTALYEFYMDTTVTTQPVVYYWSGTAWVPFIGI